MKFDSILRVSTKLFLPFIILFGVYVQFHGDYGPGGGFQAGVIIAAVIVLYALVFGLAEARRVAPPWILEAMIPAGVLIYAGTGVVTLLLGGSYLDYDVLAHDPVHAEEWGIFWVELGVLVTVVGSMASIFYAFAGRGR